MTIAYDYMNAEQLEDWQDCMRHNLPYAAGRIAWMAQIEHELNVKEGKKCTCGICVQPQVRK